MIISYSRGGLGKLSMLRVQVAVATSHLFENIEINKQCTHLISGCNIYVRAHICEVGQEKNERGIWKWVLPYAEPCKCTSVRMGGMNTQTPIRPFRPTYVSKPLVSSKIAKIRKHYGLQCSGKKDNNVCI